MIWQLKEFLVNGGGNAEYSAATDQIEAKAKALQYWEIPDESRAKINNLEPDYQRYVAVEFEEEGSVKIRFIMEKWWTWYLCASKKLKVRDPDDDATNIEALDKPNVKALDAFGEDANIKIPGQGQAKMMTLCPLLRNCVNVETVKKNAIAALRSAGVKQWEENRGVEMDQSSTRRFQHFTVETITYGEDSYGYCFILSESFDKASLSVTEHVYLPEHFIKNLGGGFDPKAKELIKNDEKEEEARRTSVGKPLWARDADGRPFLVEIVLKKRESGMKPDAWVARFKKAVALSQDDKGWNRFINPKLDIFILATNGGTNEASVIRDLVTETKKRLRLPINGEAISKPSTCKQNVQVIERDANNVRKKFGIIQFLSDEFGTLIKIGRSPFHDYETYIKKRDWKAYCTYRPSRQIFLPAQVSEVDQALANKRKAYKAEKTSKLESLRSIAKAGKGKTRARLEESLGEEDKKKLQTGRVLAIEVTASKIYAAATRRYEAPDQKEVMGDSATTISDKLKWNEGNEAQNDQWPKTSHARAEWLHRCAFSWGGLGDTRTPFKTSQVPDNIIFGSSETNSLMTRYEKAWQSLVTKVNAGQVERGKCEPHFADETQDDLLNYSNIPIPGWLCYKMRYSLHVFNHNSMGTRKNVTFETEFHPFQRPFFTKFEQELDIALLESIYKLPKNAEDEDSEGSIKLNTNVQERQDQQVEDARIGTTIRQKEEEIGLTKSRKRQDIDLFIMPTEFGGSALMPSSESYKVMALYEKPRRSKEADNGEGKGKPDGDSGKSDNDPIEEERNHGRSRPEEDSELEKESEVRKMRKSEHKVGVFQTLRAEPIFRTSEQKLSKRIKAQNALTGVSTFALEPEVATECIENDDCDSNTAPTESALAKHERIWVNLDVPGNISVDGLLLENVQVVITLPEATEAIQAPTGCAVGDLQSSSTSAISYAMTDAGLIPSSETNNSEGSALVTGLEIATEMDVSFEEEKKEPTDTPTSTAPNDSRIDMSCLLSTRRDALKTLPQPIGFTLRGVVPDVDVGIFGVLKITDIGIDLTGMRQNAMGDYSFSYGFFGSGAISDVYSDSWRNVLGISGLNLQNVLFEADWVGKNISSVTLKLQATFGMATGLILLHRVYSKENKELVGIMESCSLDTLETIYRDLTGRAIDITTNHKVEFSSLLFKVSNKGIILSGAVEIDEHTSADATITIGAHGIHISGSVSSFTVGDVEIINPAISVTILNGFNFQLSGRVKFADDHTFDVSVYVDKSSGESIEYTVYGAYRGLQLYATTSQLKEVRDVLGLHDKKPITICAYWSPGAKSPTGSSFGIDIIVDTTDVLKFGSVRSGPLSMGIEVKVGVSPKLQIGGYLYIDVAEQPDPLKLKLELKAGAAGVDGSAAMIGKWNNPLGKCKQLEIADLFTKLEIEYAVRLLSLYKLSALIRHMEVFRHRNPDRVDLHLGTSYEQLVRLDIENLDVAKFVKLIANLIEVDISIPDSKDTFYISKLLIYVSTGIVINGAEYPRGLKLDADMTILGKRATLVADVVETYVKFKGTIESFKLGDFEIRGARAIEPRIDLEISRTVQKILIDGKTTFQKDVWIVVIVDIDTNEGKLSFYFDLKVSDKLRVTITASLDGPVPNAIPEGAAGNAKLIDGVLGGTLAGKEFNIIGEMNQNMRRYLKELANKILVEIGDINHQTQLLTNLVNASAAYETAKDVFEKEKASLSENIENQTRAIDAKLAAVKEELDEAKSQYDQNTAVVEQTKRDLQSRLNTKIRDTVKNETGKDLEAARVAEQAEVALHECRMLWKMLSFAEATARQAKNKKDLAEDDLARFEVRCNEHQASEPPKDTIAHAPWEFAQTTLQDELLQKRTAAIEVTNEYKAALVAHDAAAFEATSARLTELLKDHQQAQAILRGREAAKAAAIAESEQGAEEKLHELQTKFEASATVLKTKLDLAIKKEETNRASSETAKQKILHDNDSGNSPQYKEMCEKYDKMVIAKNETESFSFLLSILATASPEINAALKYCVSVFDDSVLEIKSVKFSGKFGRSGSMAKARIDATVAGVAQSFDVEFDVRDIVNLVKELWNEITKVITTVAGNIQEIFKQGKEVMERFVKEAKGGATIVADETKKFVNNADKELDKLSKKIAEDLLNAKDSIDQVSRDLSRDLIEGVNQGDQGLRDVHREVDDLMSHLNRGIGEIGNSISGSDRRGEEVIGVMENDIRASTENEIAGSTEMKIFGIMMAQIARSRTNTSVAYAEAAYAEVAYTKAVEVPSGGIMMTKEKRDK
ncbi:hypothetical protein FBULB1_12705 [Fusarium bulbicola]|nr:hypothetical protein FBULB1_12705 [Fusarium bulbicola]